MSSELNPSVPLDEVEDAVQAALASGDPSGLNLLGQGEISLVIGWPGNQPAVACKRLPPFSSAGSAEAYRVELDRYLFALGERGLSVVPSEFFTLEPGPVGSGCPKGSIVGYVVQPVLPRETLAPVILGSTDPDTAHPLLHRIVDTVNKVVDPVAGLDAQLANWALVDGELQYMDITTPMCFDEAGRIRLDLDLFLAAYPWMLRGALRRFVAPGLVNGYTDRREVLVDLCANLHKERLLGWVPIAMRIANESGISPVITEDELARYYRRNAQQWDVMLRLRYADRWWQRKVRRRVYPFLLPRPITR